jgi:hypothetical protein
MILVLSQCNARLGRMAQYLGLATQRTSAQ